MQTNFITKKQIENKLLQLTNVKNTKEVNFVKNKEDALEAIKQHTFWLSETANNNLLHWMFKFATTDDLIFIEKHIENTIFVDKLRMIINIKTFGIDHLSVNHVDCVKFIVLNNIVKHNDKLRFVDNIVKNGNIILLKLIMKKKYPVTNFTFAAAVESNDIEKIQLLTKNISFILNDKIVQKIVKKSKSSVVLIYLHELYNFDIETICKTIVDYDLLKFVEYCKEKNLITTIFVSKLIRVGGIKWVTILENYVDLSTLFQVTSIARHMSPYFEYLVQNFDVWSILHIDSLILNIQEDNIIKILVYNIPTTTNNNIKELIFSIVSQYILNPHKKQLYISHILES